MAHTLRNHSSRDICSICTDLLLARLASLDIAQLISIVSLLSEFSDNWLVGEVWRCRLYGREPSKVLSSAEVRRPPRKRSSGIRSRIVFSRPAWNCRCRVPCLLNEENTSCTERLANGPVSVLAVERCRVTSATTYEHLKSCQSYGVRMLKPNIQT